MIRRQRNSEIFFSIAHNYIVGVGMELGFGSGKVCRQHGWLLVGYVWALMFVVLTYLFSFYILFVR